MLKKFLIKHNVIKSNFYIEAFVYVDTKTRLPVDMSDCIMWLQPFTLVCKFKDRDKQAFEMLKYKYPEYAGYFNLY